MRIAVSATLLGPRICSIAATIIVMSGCLYRNFRMQGTIVTRNPTDDRWLPPLPGTCLEAYVKTRHKDNPRGKVATSHPRPACVARIDNIKDTAIGELLIALALNVAIIW